MENSSKKFHYPLDVSLKTSPLIEAWFEVRWELEKGSIPKTLVDSQYPFALGTFYKNIQDKFNYHEELPSSKTPEGFFPYTVQHRFRVGKDAWPVLQLGPGVATANFVGGYTWDKFYKTILYLRNNLLEAYQNNGINTNGLFLRYRNAFPFDYESKDLISFFKNYMNLSVSLPQYIPGPISVKSTPTSSKLEFVYNLNSPQGVGKIQIGTGVSKVDHDDDERIVILEFEVSSTGSNPLLFLNEEILIKWLSNAHSTIHEWFMSFIDGPLYSKFSGE